MAGQRRLGSYLLVARPADLWAKVLVIPLGYLTVQWLAEPSGGVSLVTAAVAWLVFDLCLYETRYQINDLADASLDRAHVAADGRGRIPDDPRTFRWAMRAIAARLIVSVVVIGLLPGSGRTIMVVGVLGFLAVTAGYEAARTSMRRRPLRHWREARMAPRDVIVFGLVGGGYGLRVGLGAALAGADAAIVVAIVALGWAVGILAVLLAWTGEAALLRMGDGDGVLARKSHIAVLARLIDNDAEGLDRPLLTGRPAWLTAGLLAGTALVAVVFASSLGDWPEPVNLVALLAVCVVVGPVLLASWPSLWAGPAVAAMYAVAGGLLAADGSRVQMVAVLAYVSLAPAITRALRVTSVGPGRSMATEAGDCPVPKR